MQLHLELVHEPWPGERWQSFWGHVWPLYREWFLREGIDARPGYTTSRSALEEHMHELIPVYDALCALAGGGDVEARFLAMWCPPAYMAGCSQVAWTRGNPTLVRNYDYDPRFFDGRLRHTVWRKPVIGMQDSGWGLLDGMNADGLAAALAFGGRPVQGKGFGIPLVVRYVLETCSTVDQAVAVLQRLPVHMSYSVLLLDRDRHHAVVHLNPDRPARVVHRPLCTNHQEQVEWDAYAAFTATLQRQAWLEECLDDPKMDRAKLEERFLRPPLYHQQYLRGFGTLYTISYDVARGRFKVRWPAQQVEGGFRRFPEGMVHVTLLRPAGRYLTK